MAETVSAGEGHEVFRKVVVWLYENPAWTMMIMTMIVILPTWILFKHSPRNANHTLPQSVFIQIFMSTLMIVIVFLIRITTSWLLLLIPIYYFFAYRQLFGFGVWGTIWRITLCFLVWVFFILAVAFMIVAPTESDLTIGTTIRMSLIILLPAVVIIAAGVVSNIVKSRKL